MRSALSLLTIFGGPASPDSRAARWFAPIGALLGLLLGAAWWAADHLWSPLLAGILVVALDAALTGMLHLDGLADAGDGLLAPLDRERRLQAMRDPGIGAFGVVVLVSTLLLRVGALTSLAPDVLLIAGLWAGSRGFMALTMTTLPYARSEGGLASPFLGSRGGYGRADAAAIRLGLLVALVALIGTAGFPAGLAAAVGLLIGCETVARLAQRRLGGFTGDVLGAAGVMGETCGLLLAAIQW